ncbi:Pol polyprotein [Plakobranchus ocellatus]|uniref:Pol polyprotein n=1 Tax=Plakobranchus ocellatus TaxID=259542 RepID=A0AAV4E1E4_9GAST|nr:Pol polyprotein [Plakobranchus ocellatus]
MSRQAVENLPASSPKLVEIINLQKSDPETVEIKGICDRGWPAFMPQNPALQQYWTNQCHLIIVDDLFLYNYIVIPKHMHLEILNKLHEGHMGMTKCSVGTDISLVAKQHFTN